LRIWVFFGALTVILYYLYSHRWSASTTEKLSTSFHSSTVKCAFNASRFAEMKRSQYGEDEALLQYFKGRCGGTYVELGALDGDICSNTYAYNKALGWKGVLVELVPASFAKLKVNRQDELAVVHAAVCEQEGQVHFVERESATSGVWEFAAPSFRSQWWGNLKLSETVLIDCLPLRTILGQVNKDNFFADFFSLDVEGAELVVLQSIDFRRAAFGIVIVEADEHNEFKNLLVKAFLASKGYIFLKHLVNSDWFVNSQISTFYE